MIDIPTYSVTLEEMMAKKSDTQNLIPLEAIESRIFVLRGHRVMLDRDLAGLYGVETRALNQSVKRNADRFPDDFMFKLTLVEAKAVLVLRSQFVTLKTRRAPQVRSLRLYRSKPAPRVRRKTRSIRLCAPSIHRLQ